MRLSENKGDCIGIVYSVDTRKILVKVNDERLLNSIKINDIIIFDGNNNDEMLIGIVTKVSKKTIDIDEQEMEENLADTLVEIGSENFCTVVLVGTYYDKFGTKTSLFKRVVNTYPEINSVAYKANENSIYLIMNAVGEQSTGKKQLRIGKFAINQNVPAILNGNRFFQRHACIVGSTGSGKSYAVANMLEKIKELNYSNVILFDLHGEYNELSYAKHIKISSDKDGLRMPLWFFKYEEIHSLFIESSDAANQRAIVTEYILNSKKLYLKRNFPDWDQNIITVDTPLPFSTQRLLEFLKEKDVETINTGEVYKTGEKKGQEKTRQGNYYGKLTNLINRLQSKIDDKKYSFVFDESITQSHKYLNEFAKTIMDFTDRCNVKVIDVSQVPSDMLSIIIGTLTRIIYDIQFWMTPDTDEVRHPLVFICDEAHKYMPNDGTKLSSVERKTLEIFEKIAKEGRKYGIGLLVVSQRPSELNTTIFSQCNNIISLKITNDRDKNAVGNMLIDSLYGIIDMLPNLDEGECIIVGDSIMLPTKIILDKPLEPPKSATIEFWDKWSTKEKTVFDIDGAVINMINQKRF